MNKLITILEILKRKLTNLKYKTEICWEFDNKNQDNKLACFKIYLKCHKNFILENEHNFKGRGNIY
jgi:hypothetical protein